MWFLTILTFLNGVLDNRGFVLLHRVEIRGVPLNVFDLLILGGLILAFIRFRSGTRFHADRVHPAMQITMILMSLMLVVGMAASVGNGAPRYNVDIEARNEFGLLASLCLGYYFTFTVRSTKAFIWITIITGIVTALVILTFFSGQAAEMRSTTSINALRTIEYVPAYCAMAAFVLVFSIFTGARLMPAWLTALLAGVCLLGQFATLNRTDWAASFIALCSIFLFLPRGKRLSSIARSLVVIPALLGVLFVGVVVASKLSGSDFQAKMNTRIASLLPGSDTGGAKAWDTRLPSAMYELRLWSQSPLWGMGFSAEDMGALNDASMSAMHHNPMTAILCETGIIGFAAYWALFGSCFFVGRRIIRDALDKPTLLIGGLACTGAVFFLVYSVATLSINTLRGAIPLGVLCGVALRTRAIQLTLLRQWQGYLDPNMAQSADGIWTPLLDDEGQPTAAPNSGFAYSDTHTGDYHGMTV